MYCECVDVCIYIFSNIGSMILQQYENEYIHTRVCENARTSSQPPFLSHTHAHIYIYVGQFGCVRPTEQLQKKKVAVSKEIDALERNPMPQWPSAVSKAAITMCMHVKMILYM